MSPFALHELYRRWLDEVWGGVRGAAARLVAEGFVGHWPDGDVRGLHGLAAVVEQTRAMFTGIRFRLQVGPVAQGELVAARWTGSGGTASGNVGFVGNDLLRVVDVRVVEYWPTSPPPAAWARRADPTGAVL